jgi:hypothetical protein
MLKTPPNLRNTITMIARCRVIIGTYIEGSLICLDHTVQGIEKAESEGYPDGFTCDDCGRLIMV